MKRFPWFEVILAAFIAAWTVYAAFSAAPNFARNWFVRDDAYYYFKVAQNISEGHGSTFDGINPTNGYHPLWLLVCVPIFALARFDVILPLRVLLVVTGAMEIATFILLYRLMKRVISPPIAAYAVCFWAFNYQVQTIIYQQGLETAIAVFFIALLAYVLVQREEEWITRPANKKEIAVLAALAALTMFSRLDLVFLAALVGLRVVFRGSHLRDLLGIDVLFVFTSTLTAFIIRVGLPEYYQYSNAALAMIVVSMIVRAPILYFFGMYESLGAQSPLRIIKQGALAVTLGSLIIIPTMMGLAQLAHFDAFPRTTIIYDYAFMMAMVISSRLGAHWFAKDETQKTIHPLQTLKENWKRWLADGALFYGILFGALALYMLYNLIAFGTASPVSGQVKEWWGSYSSFVYGGSARTKLEFFGVYPESDFNAWMFLDMNAYQLTAWLAPYHYRWNTWWQNKYGAVLVAGLIIIAILLSISRKNTARAAPRLMILPLVAASGIQLMSYNMRGYAGVKDWYWIAQFVAMMLGSAWVTDTLARHATRLKGGMVFLWLVVIAFILPQANEYARLTYINMSVTYYPAGTPLMDADVFLEEHTEPGSLIGMTGGGNAGYFINDRTIVNMDGLINSYDYFRALQTRNAGDYLANIGLDYIFANPDILDSAPYHGQYNDKYDVYLYRFGGKVLIRLKK